MPNLNDMTLRRISPEVELWAVKEELDLAKKTIDHYTHLVPRLYDELDALRNGICNTCKAKFVPGATSSFSACRSSSRFVFPLWRRMFRGRPAGSQHDLRKTKTSTKRLDVPTESIPVSPSTQPQTSAAVAEAVKADWSVVHNPEVRQTLDVQLARTLKMKSEVHCVKFSREGKYLGVGLETGETYVYDMKTLSYRILSIAEYLGEEQPFISCIQFSPDNNYIATGAYDGQIRIWNLREKHVLTTFKGHTQSVYSLGFYPNGRFLLSGSFDRSVRIWCMRGGSSKNFLDPEMSSVKSAAISPDGRYVAAGDYDGVLRIWDFRSRRLLRRWKAKGDVRSVIFTSDGKGLLSGGRDKTLKSWDISSLITSQPGSRRVALVGGDIDEEKEHLTFRGHTGLIYSVSIVPGSRWVVSASGDSTVRMWDVRTGSWQCMLGGHKRSAWAVDASPDGRHLATGSKDHSVRIWRYKQVE